MTNFVLEQRRNRRRLRLLLLAWLGLACVAGRIAGGALEEFVAADDWMRRMEEPGWTPPLLEDHRHRFTLAFLALAYALARRAWRGADRRFLAVTRARPLEDRTARNIAGELAIAAGVPEPELHVVEDPIPNAFALGVRDREGERGTIVVTRGLLESLQRDELQAVLAHEVGHLRAGDARLMTALVGMSRAVQLLSGLALGPLRALWEAHSASELDDADEPGGPDEPPVRIVDLDGARRPAPAATPRSTSGAPPGWVLPEAPAPIRWVALFAGVMLAVPLLLLASLVGTLAVVFAFYLLLLALPFGAVAWAVYETLRGDAVDPREAAPFTDERSTRTAWSSLFFLVPVGVVTGPAILLLGVLLPLAAALGRVLVSRHREFDADVAAVELTRDPAALADALRTLKRRSAYSTAVPRWLVPLTIAPLPGRNDGAADDFVVAWRRFWSGSPALDERIRRADAMTLESRPETIVV